MRPQWPVRAKLYWCMERNVASLDPGCGGMDESIEVNIGPPGDARPAFSIDRKRLREALRNEFGDARAYDVLFGNGSFIVLNKIPYLDEMKEVIAHGTIMGRLYYEPVEARWRFRLTYPSARKLVDEGLVETLSLKPGERIRPYDKLRRQGVTTGQQVVVLDSQGEVRGIGYSQGDFVRIWNVFYTRRGCPGSGRPAGIQDFLKLSSDFFYVMESRAIGFLASMASKTGLEPVASYSGGKDSLVAMHLALRAGLEPSLLFNDTGMEFPEVREAVAEASEKYGLRLVTASAGDAFWRAVRFFGPPARDYRWCCKVAKLAPLARTARAKWPKGMLNIVGQRAYESLERARSPRVWRNKWTPYILSISPIQAWTQMAIWGYIWKYRLSYNPLYDQGFERLGCYMCPASTLAEFKVVSEIHPEMWRQWEDILWKWARRLGMPRKWVTLGLWRWLGPSSAKKRLARHAGISLGDWREWYTRWIKGKPILRTEAGRDVKAVLKLPLKASAKALEEQYAAIALELVSKNPLELRRIKAYIRMKENTIEAWGPGLWVLEDLMDAGKLVYRWHNCVGCGNCEASCPTGAISIVSGRPIINASKCLHCRLCIYNCPISDVFFEHLVAALALDRYDAWRRTTRPPRKLVVEAAKKLLGSGRRAETGMRSEGTPPSWQSLLG